jgi:hypothetical protein
MAAALVSCVGVGVDGVPYPVVDLVEFLCGFAYAGVVVVGDRLEGFDDDAGEVACGVETFVGGSRARQGMTAA